MGEVCLMTAPEALRCGTTRGLPTQELRFEEGEQVSCRVEELGGSYVWEEGIVVGLWYREHCWPDEHPGAPYEIMLDVGLRVFALVDHDRIIRKHIKPRGASKSHSSNSHLGLARFVKQTNDAAGHCYEENHGHGHHGHSHGHGHK